MSYKHNNPSSNSLENLENRTFLSAAPMVESSHHFGKHFKVAPLVAPRTTPVAPTTVAPKASATGLTPVSVVPAGTQLIITGTAGNDTITVSQNGNVYTIKNGDWSTTVTGSFKKLVVTGNGGILDHHSTLILSPNAE